MTFTFWLNTTNSNKKVHAWIVHNKINDAFRKLIDREILFHADFNQAFQAIG